MKILLLLTIWTTFSINAFPQRQIKIDSIGKVYGQSMELISGDSVFIYRWRGGVKKQKVIPGMFAQINPPTRRIRHYFINLKK